MGNIHLLEDSVINKIAAGEVVERPSSVVKELVENALDAGSTQVEISLEMGGLRSIVITDNGGGMPADDAAKALQRHATSKLRDADQLFSISSMGFRGEALASIAAISQFSLATKEATADVGTKITVAGGDPSVTLPWQGPTGTTVAVENIFFNVPVRAKFLKSPGTEFSHCLELIQAFALCRPSVGFVLKHNGREQLRLPALSLTEAPWFGEDVLRERSRAIIGKDVAQLVYVRTTGRYGDLEALVSPPGVEKGTGKSMFSFVNGRLVRDKVLRYGILRGYHSHLLKGKFPVVVMHLRTDPALVDVNVHPAKTEVRFQYPEEVQNLIALGIREKLRSGAWVGLEPETSATAPNQAAANSLGSATPPWSLPMSESSAARHEASADASPMRVQSAPFRSQSSAPRMTLSTRSNGYGAESMTEGEGYSSKQKNDWSSTPVTDKASIDALLAHSSGESSVPVSGGSRFAPGADDISAAGMPAVSWGDMQYMGTFARCYMMFTDQSRFLVVDQHAFHERIIYERLQRDRSLLQQSQRLLVPEALELAPASVAVLQERQADLKLRGFDFAIEGATTVLVNAVPSLLAGRDLNGLFEDLGEGLGVGDAGAGPCSDPCSDLGMEATGIKEPTDSNGEMLRLLLANVACHAAVRAGEELPLNEVKQLVAEASTVDFYHNCPHGRRVLRWWSKAQVEQWFDR